MGFTPEQLNALKQSTPKLFHRTFISDRTEAEAAKKLAWQPIPASQLDRMTHPQRSPSISADPEREVKRLLRTAYYTDGKTLTPTRIWARDGQNFADYATPWERKWSSLLNNRYDAFQPIVNEFDTLVGHYGRITSEKILSNQLPDGYSSYDFVSLYDNFDLMVGNEHAEAGLGYRRALFTFAYYTVQTSIDGDIVSGVYSGPTNNGQATPVDISPIDLAANARLIFSALTIIQRIGSRAMQTIARKIAAKRIETALTKRFQLKFGYDPRTGIPSEHLDAMIAACKETEVIAIFRANKSAAIPLIRQGAHGKPMWAKFNTSPKTGVLTASTEAHKNLAYENGAFVIHPDTISSRTAIRFTKGPDGKLIKETTKLEGDWPIEPWQVVGKDGKPFVGDYDLLGVAPIRSPGSNVSLVPEDIVYGDWTGPWVEKYRAAINRRLGKPRVLHGPLDAYGGPPELRGFKEETVYAVYPNGGIVVLDGKKAQEDFYEYIGRQAKSKLPAPIGDPNFKLHAVN